MHVVVPLAGPDFVRPDGSLKARVMVDGSPLLLGVLSSRPWADVVNPGAYTFVFHDDGETRAFARGELTDWFPGCRTVFLSDFARGAALSAAAGVVATGGNHSPLIVDLADIGFSSRSQSTDVLTRPGTGGLAFAFTSSEPIYSYLRVDGNGRVTEAAEKRVISTTASAGVYGFANSSVYLRALAHSLEHEEQTYRRLHYVCPLFNGVIAQKLEVRLEPVWDVIDVKQFGIE